MRRNGRGRRVDVEQTERVGNLDPALAEQAEALQQEIQGRLPCGARKRRSPC
jgi:hypothetical protein